MHYNRLAIEQVKVGPQGGSFKSQKRSTDITEVIP